MPRYWPCFWGCLALSSVAACGLDRAPGSSAGADSGVESGSGGRGNGSGAGGNGMGGTGNLRPDGSMPNGGRGGSGAGANGAGTGGNMRRCDVGNGGCSPLVECSEVDGEIECGPCPSTSEDPIGDGRQCMDIDECARGTDLCDDDPPASCTNRTSNGRDGSEGYTCVCPNGYSGVASLGHDCVIIDPGTSGTGGGGAGDACSNDTDTCDDDPDSCVVDGDSFTCMCPAGYDDVNDDGSDCQDIDECTNGTAQCTGPATCENNPGNFRCRCPDNTLDLLGDGSECVSGGHRVAVGESHTCVLLDGGQVKCWGSGNYGRLGLGDTVQRGGTPATAPAMLPAVDLGTGARAVSIVAGCYHNCAILNDGTVKCWGNNEFGQLGLGDTENRGDQAGEMGDELPIVDLPDTVTQISAGCEYTCALLTNGDLKCWGIGQETTMTSGTLVEAYGQIGTGNVDDTLGDELGEMGSALPTVDLGGQVVEFQAGYRFACARLDTNEVKCWGRGDAGRLGTGDENNRGDNPSEMGANLLPIELGTGLSATAVAAGFTNGCALLNSTELKCWGYGAYGQLGTGDISDVGDQPNEMGDALPEIAVMPGRYPIDLAMGPHTCVILDDRSIQCWGRNQYGQLGLGDIDNRGDDPNGSGSGDESPDTLPAVDLGAGRAVLKLFTQQGHVCALLDNGEVKCWGANSLGQLGIGLAGGANQARGDAPGEMGDALPAAVDLW